MYLNNTTALLRANSVSWNDYCITIDSGPQKYKFWGNGFSLTHQDKTWKFERGYSNITFQTIINSKDMSLDEKLVFGTLASIFEVRKEFYGDESLKRRRTLIKNLQKKLFFKQWSIFTLSLKLSKRASKKWKLKKFERQLLIYAKLRLFGMLDYEDTKEHRKKLLLLFKKIKKVKLIS